LKKERKEGVNANTPPMGKRGKKIFMKKGGGIFTLQEEKNGGLPSEGLFGKKSSWEGRGGKEPVPLLKRGRKFSRSKEGGSLQDGVKGRRREHNKSSIGGGGGKHNTSWRKEKKRKD